jgi:hypothetical protein
MPSRVSRRTGRAMVMRRTRFFLVLLLINACMATYAGLTGPPYLWFWLEVLLCGWLLYMAGVEVYLAWWIRHHEGIPPKL